MRHLVLYLRSRQIAAATAVAVAGTAAMYWLDRAVGGLGPGPLLAALAAALGTAAFASGMEGDDVALDRTASIAWPRWRAAHVIAVVAIVAGAGHAVTLMGDPLAPPEVILRDVAGLGGLTALTATLLGASRAWLGAVTWTTMMIPAQFLAATGTWHAEVLTWMIQAPGSTPATITAGVLAVTGTLTYAAAGRV